MSTLSGLFLFIFYIGGVMGAYYIGSLWGWFGNMLGFFIGLKSISILTKSFVYYHTKKVFPGPKLPTCKNIECTSAQRTFIFGFEFSRYICECGHEYIYDPDSERLFFKNKDGTLTPYMIWSLFDEKWVPDHSSPQLLNEYNASRKRISKIFLFPRLRYDIILFSYFYTVYVLTSYLAPNTKETNFKFYICSFLLIVLTPSAIDFLNDVFLFLKRLIRAN
jgi:hypothetical protein